MRLLFGLFIFGIILEWFWEEEEEEEGLEPEREVEREGEGEEEDNEEESVEEERVEEVFKKQESSLKLLTVRLGGFDKKFLKLRLLFCEEIFTEAEFGLGR